MANILLEVKKMGKK